MAKKTKKQPKVQEENPQIPETPKQKATGLKSAIKLGEMTAKQALAKVKSFPWVHPKTLAWYEQRAKKEAGA